MVLKDTGLILPEPVSDANLEIADKPKKVPPQAVKNYRQFITLPVAERKNHPLRESYINLGLYFPEAEEIDD